MGRVYYLTFFRDNARDIRWHVKHKNGHTIADSGEGYRNYEDAFNAARNLFGWWKWRTFSISRESIT